MVSPYTQYTAGGKKVDEDDIDNWIDSEIVGLYNIHMKIQNNQPMIINLLNLSLFDI